MKGPRDTPIHVVLAVVAVVHLATMFKVDVFLPKGRAFDEAQLSRSAPQIITTNPERTAVVASAEDTILAKLSWYRAGEEVSEQQ